MLYLVWEVLKPQANEWRKKLKKKKSGQTPAGRHLQPTQLLLLRYGVTSEALNRDMAVCLLFPKQLYISVTKITYRKVCKS